MSFANHTSRIYMDEFDVRGAVKVGVDKAREALDAGDSDAYWMYMGAAHALNLLANHERIETQDVFWRLYDQTIPGYEKQGE